MHRSIIACCAALLAACGGGGGGGGPGTPPVNAAPVVTTSAGPVAYVENAAAAALDSGIAVADADGSTLAGATVRIATGCTESEDVLALPSPPAGIAVAGYTPATCTLSLTGTASVATYQAALRQVTYANTSEAPATASRVVRFTADDGQDANHAGSADRSLTVTSVDDAPVAVNDALIVAENAPATAMAVLDNDTDVDAGPRSISAVSQPANGTVAITGGGAGLTYTPSASYCNAILPAAGGASTPAPAVAPPAETFTYTLSPGGSTATVSVTVTCVDQPPIGVADVATVAEGSGATPVDVLANDADPDAGPRAVASITQPAHGTAAIAPGGLSVTYAPASGYCNEAPNAPRDTFTYTLAPGGTSATVSVAVTCACGLHKPTDFVVGSN
jgi:Bacterial cadherin-like domain